MFVCDISNSRRWRVSNYILSCKLQAVTGIFGVLVCCCCYNIYYEFIISPFRQPNVNVQWRDTPAMDSCVYWETMKQPCIRFEWNDHELFKLIAHWFICHIWPYSDFWIHFRNFCLQRNKRTLEKESVSSVKMCKFNEDRWKKEWFVCNDCCVDLQLIIYVFQLSQKKHTCRNVYVQASLA